jgi:formamidopyrimidine-DNA glycosylase
VPELPDLLLYTKALRARAVGHPLLRVRLASPFLLRSVTPPLAAFEGCVLEDMRLLGKRLVFVFPGSQFLVLHLMIAGRLRWRERGATIPAKVGLAAFDFEEGTLLLTEAGARRQASIHIVNGSHALHAHDPGGIEVMETDLQTFARQLVRENHTLKRALTDPRIFSGIGNAYSDEILHGARLSPMKLTSTLTEAEIETLYHATGDTLRSWIDRLREETGDRFPEKVTAFRPDMAVHGKYGKPCPVCGSPIQRIVYARNEANYCSQCQTGGRLLSDRALSRLLRDDWPKTLEDLEERKRAAR